MKTYQFCLLLAVSTCAFATAQAQQGETHPSSATASGRTTVVNEATSETGTLLPKRVKWTSPIPLTGSYERLSQEQKAQFHAMYESLAPGDEPPFPEKGMKPIISAINKGHSLLMARGELNMAVTVGPDGKATKVADFGKTNNPEMVEFVAQVLLMTPFKPAVCSGKPCAMDFPFKLTLNGTLHKRPNKG
jgi:hypothetical protein